VFLLDMSGLSKSFLRYDRRTRSSRVLIYVLLVLVGYGSTFGLTHRHGNLSPKISQPNSYSITDSLAARDGTTSTTHPKSGDCLVCQFQQNLSNAETFTPLVIHASTKSPSIIRIVTVSFLTNTRTTRQSRAPPVTC
jgi:hypothetical protein